jgi:rRNA-processing protein FCF1
MGSVASGITQQERLQGAYAAWVEEIENALRQYFDSSWVWDGLFTPRWAEIRNLVRTSPRWYPLINDEIKAQQRRINALLDRLEASQIHFELPSGCIAVVPDTNVFLHYTFFRDLDWTKLAKDAARAKEVRLVVPLVVVEQLDEQSYREANASRAKAALRELRSRLDLTAPESPVELLKAKVKVQLLGEPRGHRPRRNSDDEILDRAEHLVSLVGDRVYVATGDLSMQTRAVMRGLKCLLLPEEMRERQ